MGGVRVVKIDQARLAELVAQRPDATVRELRELLGVECSESAVGFALQRLGLSFKKRRSMRPSRTALTSRRSGDDGDVGSTTLTHAG
jgi:transposase